MVQRVRHELKRRSDADGLLQRAIEVAFIDKGLMSAFLPVPFTADSGAGIRLSEALERVKTRYPHLATIQDFHWRFWNSDIDAAGEGVNFDEAFSRSLSLSAEEVGI